MPAAPHLGHSDTSAHVDAFIAVQPGHQSADLLAEHRCQRRGLRLDQHNVDSQSTQAGRHLATDESGADHHRAVRLRRVPAQSQALVEGTQHPDSLQIGKRRNAPWHQACRDDEFVVAQR